MDADPKGESLSPRLLQVLDLMASGHNARGIGEALGLKTPTAKIHMTRVRRLLGAKNNPHAVYLAMKAGIIDRLEHDMDLGEAVEILGQASRGNLTLDARFREACRIGKAAILRAGGASETR